MGLWLNSFADFSKWTRSASRFWSIKTLNFLDAVFSIWDESILTKSTGKIFSLSNDLYSEYFLSLIFWMILLYWARYFFSSEYDLNNSFSISLQMEIIFDFCSSDGLNLSRFKISFSRRSRIIWRLVRKEIGNADGHSCRVTIRRFYGFKKIASRDSSSQKSAVHRIWANF